MTKTGSGELINEPILHPRVLFADVSNTTFLKRREAKFGSCNSLNTPVTKKKDESFDLRLPNNIILPTKKANLCEEGNKGGERLCFSPHKTQSPRRCFKDCLFSEEIILLPKTPEEKKKENYTTSAQFRRFFKKPAEPIATTPPPRKENEKEQLPPPFVRLQYFDLLKPEKVLLNDSSSTKAKGGSRCRENEGKVTILWKNEVFMKLFFPPHKKNGDGDDVILSKLQKNEEEKKEEIPSCAVDILSAGGEGEICDCDVLLALCKPAVVSCRLFPPPEFYANPVISDVQSEDGDKLKCALSCEKGEVDVDCKTVLSQKNMAVVKENYYCSEKITKTQASFCHSALVFAVNNNISADDFCNTLSPLFSHIFTELFENYQKQIINAAFVVGYTKMVAFPMLKMLEYCGRRVICMQRDIGIRNLIELFVLLFSYQYKFQYNEGNQSFSFLQKVQRFFSWKNDLYLNFSHNRRDLCYKKRNLDENQKNVTEVLPKIERLSIKHRKCVKRGDGCHALPVLQECKRAKSCKRENNFVDITAINVD